MDLIKLFENILYYVISVIAWIAVIGSFIIVGIMIYVNLIP